MNKQLHFKSNVTGELVESIYDVIKTIMFDFVTFGFYNLSWEYSKNGF